MSWVRRNKLAVGMAVIALVAVAALVFSFVAWKQQDTANPAEGTAQYGNDPTKPYADNPQDRLGGAGYTPTPDDVLAPPDASAEQYPGFPPGTTFDPTPLTDPMTMASVKIATKFWRTVHLRAGCSPMQVTRYTDPEKQTIARSTVGGCHTFVDVNTPIPRFRTSWNAMGYCNMIVHEYGHSASLGHSSNPRDIMFFQGNSRARTGCEKFAPNKKGTVALPGIPQLIRCMDGNAVRRWMTGQQTEALKLSQESSFTRTHCLWLIKRGKKITPKVVTKTKHAAKEKG
jgi:hypothetical protein